MEKAIYYEDYELGSVRETMGRTITETDIVIHAGQVGDFFPHHMILNVSVPCAILCYSVWSENRTWNTYVQYRSRNDRESDQPGCFFIWI